MQEGKSRSVRASCHSAKSKVGQQQRLRNNIKKTIREGVVKGESQRESRARLSEAAVPSPFLPSLKVRLLPEARRRRTEL